MYEIIRCDPKLFEKNLGGRVYIVTGTNSGTGLATTEQLVRQGAHVIAACRRVDAWQGLVSVPFLLIPDGSGPTWSGTRYPLGCRTS